MSKPAPTGCTRVVGGMAFGFDTVYCDKPIKDEGLCARHLGAKRAGRARSKAAYEEYERKRAAVEARIQIEKAFLDLLDEYAGRLLCRWEDRIEALVQIVERGYVLREVERYATDTNG